MVFKYHSSFIYFVVAEISSLEWAFSCYDETMLAKSSSVNQYKGTQESIMRTYTPLERKTVSNQNVTTEIPNFERTDVNNWSVNCSETVIYAYFKYLRGHFEWLETEGQKLMAQATPLTLAQLQEFNRHLYCLESDISRLKPLTTYLQLVLKKAISSLKELAEGGKIGGEEEVEYWRAICSWLEAAAPCGVNSHECSYKESTALIDSLIPVAQTLKSEALLEKLAYCRYAGREGNVLPREIFQKHFKNWQ